MIDGAKSIKRFFLHTGQLLHKIVGRNSTLSIDIDLHSHQIPFEGRDQVYYQLYDKVFMVFLQDVVCDQHCNVVALNYRYHTFIGFLLIISKSCALDATMLLNFIAISV